MTQSWFDTIPAASIQAILFDMDGTLIDSEVVGARVITDWLFEMGLDPNKVNIEEMEGVTWDNIAATIHAQFPKIEHSHLARALAERFDQYQSTWPAPEIPGAIQTVRRAAMVLKTAIVTSSVRSTAELLVERFALGEVINSVISVEDVKTPNPTPRRTFLLRDGSGSFHKDALCSKTAYPAYNQREVRA